MKNLGEGLSSGSNVMDAKLNFLIDVITQGVWPRYILSVVGFVVISLVFAIFLGAWASESAEQKQDSFILLSKAAEDRRKKVLKKQQRDWFMFILSLITSVITGIVGNLLFTNYFGKL